MLWRGGDENRLATSGASGWVVGWRRMGLVRSARNVSVWQPVGWFTRRGSGLRVRGSCVPKGSARLKLGNRKSAFLPPVRRRGFSLIELVVVITILSVLAAIVVPRVAGRSEDARRAKAVADVESIGLALDLFAADNGRYPTGEQGLAALRETPVAAPTPRAWNGPYLKKELPLDPWGRPYLYQSPGNHDTATYDLASFGADGQPGGVGADADVTSWENR